MQKKAIAIGLTVLMICLVAALWATSSTQTSSNDGIESSEPFTYEIESSQNEPSSSEVFVSEPAISEVFVEQEVVAESSEVVEEESGVASAEPPKSSQEDIDRQNQQLQKDPSKPAVSMPKTFDGLTKTQQDLIIDMFKQSYGYTREQAIAEYNRLNATSELDYQGNNGKTGGGGTADIWK